MNPPGNGRVHRDSLGHNTGHIQLIHSVDGNHAVIDKNASLAVALFHGYGFFIEVFNGPHPFQFLVMLYNVIPQGNAAVRVIGNPANIVRIENIGDGGWTNNGWAKYKKEFEEVFRGLTMMGYAVVFISHSKEATVKDQAGNEHTSIRPSIQSSALAIIENMTDLYGYAHQIPTESGETEVVLTLRKPANVDIACGGRFKYITPQIPFNYNSLSKALVDAIDKEAKENNNQFVTEEREAVNTHKEYEFDALMAEFQELIGGLMTKDQNYYQPRITQIIEKYLGKGKKIAGVTRDQAELVYLIVDEIKAELINK